MPFSFPKTQVLIFGERLLYFKIWSDNNQKSVLDQKLQNVKPVEVLNLSETGEESVGTNFKNARASSLFGIRFGP